MNPVIEDRRTNTKKRIEEFKQDLNNAEAIAANHACVYVTGSFGRIESSEYSDLDIFIVGNGDARNRELSKLDEICLKAKLIEMTRTRELPEFSGDGEYLNHYSVGELKDGLGKPEDDATNTFTARLLLLLESNPLVGTEVYTNVIQEVVAAYWRDYEDHSSNFIPAFLSNDILRLWRTFCVNYEARSGSETPEKNAKRKLKNYKLKHSRMLTCYSALLYLLNEYKLKHTITPTACIDMVQLSPTERIESIISSRQESESFFQILLEQYAQFLQETNAKEIELVEKFMLKDEAERLKNAANDFGDTVFLAMETMKNDSQGDLNRFYRLLVV